MDIIALHEDAMRMAGQEPAALVRRDMLESAVAQAKQVAWYSGAPVPELTVHLTTHLAMAHAWVDGNKRTAGYAGIQFAAMNGARDPSPPEMIEFANRILEYIEVAHDGRDAVFADFVKLVETWFA